MKLFEYEAKNILKRYGITIPKGKVARNPSEAACVAKEIAKPVFLKSQILVAGRGKAGGILLANSSPEARKIAEKLIDIKIKDILVSTLLVEEKIDIAKELYVSLAVDRQAKSFVVLASATGGVDIEGLALFSPDKIVRHWIDPISGLNERDAMKIAACLGLSKDKASKVAQTIMTLYQVAIECDAELVEINPFVMNLSGEFVAADAKMIIDDNAIFRHPEFVDRSFHREEDTPREAEARRLGFAAYVDLDGDIGIIGNGAGLLMATLDLVQICGGKAANFLDIGGGARVEVVKDAMMFVISKPEVKGVLINILGGITRCDFIAQGIVEGLRASAVQKPIAVRMMGTKEKEGEDILRQAGIGIYATMEEATKAIIEVVEETSFEHYSK